MRDVVLSVDGPVYCPMDRLTQVTSNLVLIWLVCDNNVIHGNMVNFSEHTDMYLYTYIVSRSVRCRVLAKNLRPRHVVGCQWFVFNGPTPERPPSTYLIHHKLSAGHFLHLYMYM